MDKSAFLFIFLVLLTHQTFRKECLINFVPDHQGLLRDRVQLERFPVLELPFAAQMSDFPAHLRIPRSNTHGRIHYLMLKLKKKGLEGFYNGALYSKRVLNKDLKRLYFIEFSIEVYIMVLTKQRSKWMNWVLFRETPKNQKDIFVA